MTVWRVDMTVNGRPRWPRIEAPTMEAARDKARHLFEDIGAAELNGQRQRRKGRGEIDDRAYRTPTITFPGDAA